MKNQVFNPYLPSWEYVPDGEPHVFGDRVYVYGSHDAFGAPIFCVNDYVCWSAPVNDLSDWRYEGVIYKKTQDPGNRLGIRSLYAPDVTRGPDGRYYLYYAFDFLGEFGVAVCDTPAGKYEFYGKVRHKNGKVWGKKSGEQFPFDPGVLTDDDGRVWLYSGFETKVPFVASRWHNLRNDGGVVMELEPDMITIKQEPKVIFPIKGRPGAFPHAFFEASSIRKVDGKYCFVYSSQYNHDLCYAVSDRPDGDFKYGGVLVDLGDLYLNGNTDEEHANNYLGNTHGGMLNIGDDWYIFYHRQTNRTSYARQACAEKLERTPDGGFRQAEVTSCGLNGGPLRGKGTYEARIACNLWAKGHRTARVDRGAKATEGHPYFTQTGKDRECDGDQYIANMRDGATAGFKYFAFDGTEGKISVTGRGGGQFLVTDGENTLATVPMNGTSLFTVSPGVHPLYFIYEGEGPADFVSFTVE
ncbi:MAG: family 43 glycosylhydrolase [Oscillospiraceae bacterium]|nr:family 43 glycosylhydrolase [Oscillospiraceae bacterium]